MTLKLVKAELKYKKMIIEMLEEWSIYNKEHPNENTSPYAIFRHDYHDFDFYVNHLDQSEAKDGLVCDSTYFCLDEDKQEMVGAINIRHELNEYLYHYGGHIGDGIRPSKRRQGYATKMIHLGLIECKKLGIERVLMVCDKNNIGSAKSIINNGGIHENDIQEENQILSRYWIDLKKFEI